MVSITLDQAPCYLGKRSSRWRDFLYRLKKSRGAVTGLILIFLLVCLTILAPFLTPFNPIKVDSHSSLQAPSTTHFFGTDQYGRDVFSRVLFGSRISLTIGLISVGIASVIGILVGLVSGYYGGWIDSILMRMIDIMLAFPGILLALAIVSILGPSITNLMIAVGISSIPGYARLTRGCVLSTREEVYILAAHSIGIPNNRILLRHILPNVIAPNIIAATLGVGSSILWAAALSFLGLGSQPPTPEWGRMLSEGRQYMADQWWMSTFPGFAIMLTVFAVNLLGDGLRDALDPHLKE